MKLVFEKEASGQQLLPVYKKYYGPAADFDNLRMKEFHFSENYYGELTTDADNDEALNNLVAVLYRPAKKKYDTVKNVDGDIRIHFNHNETAYHAKQIARWPEAVKQAIFLWYHTCRMELIDNNKTAFSVPDDGYTSEFDTGIYGMMRMLAGDKLGSITAVEEMYVHTAILEVGLLKEQEKIMDEQMKQQTP